MGKTIWKKMNKKNYITSGANIDNRGLEKWEKSKTTFSKTLNVVFVGKLSNHPVISDTFTPLSSYSLDRLINSLRFPDIRIEPKRTISVSITSCKLTGVPINTTWIAKVAPYNNRQVQVIFDIEELIPSHHVARLVYEMVEAISYEQIFSHL